MEIKQSNQVVLVEFPQTNLTQGKMRPAVLIAPLPNPYHDWLAAMVTTQLDKALLHYDELILRKDPDFRQSGLKEESAILCSRLLVVTENKLIGCLGQISSNRLLQVKQKIIKWIQQSR